MAHSKKYNTVKKYYDMGMWSISMVANAVVKGWITATEYESITHAAYSEHSEKKGA